MPNTASLNSAPGSAFTMDQQTRQAILAQNQLRLMRTLGIDGARRGNDRYEADIAPSLKNLYAAAAKSLSQQRANPKEASLAAQKAQGEPALGESEPASASTPSVSASASVPNQPLSSSAPVMRKITKSADGLTYSLASAVPVLARTVDKVLGDVNKLIAALPGGAADVVGAVTGLAGGVLPATDGANRILGLFTEKQQPFFAAQSVSSTATKVSEAVTMTQAETAAMIKDLLGVYAAANRGESVDMGSVTTSLGTLAGGASSSVVRSIAAGIGDALRTSSAGNGRSKQDKKTLGIRL